MEDFFETVASELSQDCREGEAVAARGRNRTAPGAGGGHRLASQEQHEGRVAGAEGLQGELDIILDK